MSWNDQELINNHAVSKARYKKPNAERIKQKIARDVEKFLRAGGTIKKLPSIHNPRKPMLEIGLTYN